MDSSSEIAAAILRLAEVHDERLAEVAMALRENAHALRKLTFGEAGSDAGAVEHLSDALREATLEIARALRNEP